MRDLARETPGKTAFSGEVSRSLGRAKRESIERRPMEIEAIERIGPQYDVLVFNAHPDDIEMAAGGTLLKLLDSGKSVLNVVFTRGDAGRHGTVEDRVQEMARAADFGGYDFLFLDRADCELFFDRETRDVAVRCIRRARPSLVLCPYHTNYQGHRDGINHEDHLALGKAVTAAMKIARVAKYLPDAEEPPYLAERLLYYMVPRFTVPSLIVDVSDQASRLKGLIECFATQTNITRSGKPILEVLFEWRKLLGASVGIELGESLLSEEPLVVGEPGGLCRRSLSLG